MGLMLSACSDFLDRKPLTQPDNTTFLSGREQVENYINAHAGSRPTGRRGMRTCVMSTISSTIIVFLK